MTLKIKLQIGIIFLFLLVLLVGGLAIYSTEKLSNGTEIILQDNYETLECVEQMRAALEAKDWRAFDQSLKKQEGNITEIGENEATKQVREGFEKLRKNIDNQNFKEVTQPLSKIAEINRQAILKKYQRSQKTAQSVKNWITLLGTFCFLIAFSFVFNFSEYISSPVRELTEGIQAIAKKKYDHRILYQRHDEFGKLAEVFNQMASQLEDWENSNVAKILFEKRRVETVIESLKDATLGIDEAGVVLFANRQALHLLNLKENEMVGQLAKETARRNDLLEHLLQSHDIQPLKIVVDGKESYFTIEKIDILQESKRLGVVIVLKNITSFKELDLAKTHFIATISHELKTPIASTDLSLKLLQDTRLGALTEQQNDIIENIKTDNQRLIRIVSELLDLSQVESGQLNLTLQPTAIEDVIEKALKAVQTSLKDKQIEVQIAQESNLPAVCADGEKLTWVLVNFLTNAIRYSSFGEKIIITAIQSDQQVRLSVRDFGKGITPEQQFHLFDRYYKGTESSAKQTGLGLAISKEFVEAMYGYIGVMTHEKGAEFFVTLQCSII